MAEGRSENTAADQWKPGHLANHPPHPAPPQTLPRCRLRRWPRPCPRSPSWAAASRPSPWPQASVCRRPSTSGPSAQARLSGEGGVASSRWHTQQLTLAPPSRQARHVHLGWDQRPAARRRLQPSQADAGHQGAGKSRQGLGCSRRGLHVLCQLPTFPPALCSPSSAQAGPPLRHHGRRCADLHLLCSAGGSRQRQHHPHPHCSVLRCHGCHHGPVWRRAGASLVGGVGGYPNWAAWPPRR